LPARPFALPRAATMQAGNQKTERRSGGLDTLRGGAVLAVLAWHCLNNTSVLRTPALSFLQEFSSHFFFGVDLFFVLSGFLIGGALMESRDAKDYFSRYAARRAGRIFPLYAAWLAAFGLMSLLGAERLGGAFPWLLGLDGMPYWSFLTFTQNFYSADLGTWGPMWLGVTWTLAIEVHFYVLAAILVYLVPVRWMGPVSLAIIILAFSFQIYGWPSFGGQEITVLTPVRLDAPFAGVFCAWLWRAQATRELVGRHALPLKCAALALVAGAYVDVVYGAWRDPDSNFTANAIIFGLATLAFAGPDTGSPSWPVRFMRWCGVRCYGLYMFHVGILGLVAHVIFTSPPNEFRPGMGWPAVTIGLAITFALAAASWRYFERPIMRWAARAAVRRQGADAFIPHPSASRFP
jgi:peptidoglycan/LPS O-acetylase OafA/YrhL